MVHIGSSTKPLAIDIMLNYPAFLKRSKFEGPVFGVSLSLGSIIGPSLEAYMYVHICIYVTAKT